MRPTRKLYDILTGLIAFTATAFNNNIIIIIIIINTIFMIIVNITTIITSLKTSFAKVPGGGGHLGIYWVGMCHPGLQIGTPFKKKFPQNWYPVLEMGQFFIPCSRIHPKTDTPFWKWANYLFSILGCNKSTTVCLLMHWTVFLKAICPWILSNGCLQKWSFRASEILYPVLGNASETDTLF